MKASLSGNPSQKPSIETGSGAEKPQEPELKTTWKNRFARKKNGQKTTGLRELGHNNGWLKSLKSRLTPTRIVAAQNTLKTSRTMAKIIHERRIFTSKEFLSAIGNPLHRGKQLIDLCKILDNFNHNVASPNSTLSATEKLTQTLELDKKLHDFVNRKKLSDKGVSKKPQRISIDAAIAHAVMAQLDSVLLSSLLNPRQDNTENSTALCQYLCDDITKNNAQRLKKLSSKPELFTTILSQIKLADLNHLAKTQGENMGMTDPKQVRATTTAVGKVVNQLSSEELRVEQQRYYDDYTNMGKSSEFPRNVQVTGNIAYDRSAISTEIINHFFNKNEDVTAIGIAMHQIHEDGYLTMDKLDEMTEQKITAMMIAAISEADVEGISNMANDILPQQVKSLRCYEQLQKARDQLASDKPHTDDPAYILWLGKVCQFQGMLTGDSQGTNEQYHDFIHTWDRLRFEAMPQYNTRHGKDNLVETDPDTSIELAKITPAFLAELDANAGNAEAIKKLLNQKGWQKVSDTINYKEVISRARTTNNKSRIKQLTQSATQDCLFRFFEARGGVDIPAITPRIQKIKTLPPRE
ncbi:hypothetical protein ACH42_08975 [Endozoicomonas sp. (ex Bugula neritina AB1)]|nr:hypothetical protein ACH42_08975 [Endozoicomonas sp. (ex Bugula neritina AB1)]